MIAGISIGMAAEGLKPVAEIQFLGFIYPALDQIINHASRLRNRTRGRLSCPMVIRTPYGAGIRAPEHHSESTEALFAHIPGLRVVIPSSPCVHMVYYWLLFVILILLFFLNLVVFIGLLKQNVPDNGEALPLDTLLCITRRERCYFDCLGRNVT